MVKEKGLVKKLGTVTPYIKSRISPPIIISYPGAIATSSNAKSTVMYQGKRNVLKKNRIVNVIRRIIVVIVMRLTVIELQQYEVFVC